MTLALTLACDRACWTLPKSGSGTAAENAGPSACLGVVELVAVVVFAVALGRPAFVSTVVVLVFVLVGETDRQLLVSDTIPVATDAAEAAADD